MVSIIDLLALPFGSAIAMFSYALALACALSLWLLKGYVVSNHRRTTSRLPPLPEIPGLPVVGNLLQLKEKKPHKTFTKWAQHYGPIYSIKTGASSVVVVNSNAIAKEAMVTRFSSISTRRLPHALMILSANKSMVATSDYNEYHKTTKKHLLANLLGTSAQKQYRVHRDTLIENSTKKLHACLQKSPQEAVVFKSVIQRELFKMAMKQVLGTDVESIYVEDLGRTMSRDEIFQVLVLDPMEGAIEVDWREFFPYLRWIPNKSFENKIKQLCIRRQAVMKALIQVQRKRIASGEKINCYIDHLLAEEKALPENEMIMLLWEPIIEASDTTTITMEWAMYELAKDKKRQDRLYEDIEKVCGSNKITEENLNRIPYVFAIVHETLRTHAPVPLIPLRYVHEDTELGGYHVPAGMEVALNLYGCNMDKKVWENPEEWKPERFLCGTDDAIFDFQKTISFGGGKRVCAGAPQAMSISCIGIARLVQEFEWRLKDGEEEDVDTVLLTAHKLHPMQAFTKPRK